MSGTTVWCMQLVGCVISGGAILLYRVIPPQLHQPELLPPPPPSRHLVQCLLPVPLSKIFTCATISALLAKQSLLYQLKNSPPEMLLFIGGFINGNRGELLGLNFSSITIDRFALKQIFSSFMVEEIGISIKSSLPHIQGLRSYLFFRSASFIRKLRVVRKCDSNYGGS